MLKPTWRDTNSSDTLIAYPFHSAMSENKFELFEQELLDYVKRKHKKSLFTSKFVVDKQREYLADYKISATWIGMTNKIAHSDYDRELDDCGRTGVIKWDDSSSNKLVTGDYFGFIDSRDDIRMLNIYKIIKVLRPEYRRDEWSRNGYTDGNSETHTRNCIILDSNIIQSVNWKEYLQSVGYKKQYLQGTTKIRYSSLFNKLD